MRVTTAFLGWRPWVKRDSLVSALRRCLFELHLLPLGWLLPLGCSVFGLHAAALFFLIAGTGLGSGNANRQPGRPLAGGLAFFRWSLCIAFLSIAVFVLLWFMFAVLFFLSVSKAIVFPWQLHWILYDFWELLFLLLSAIIAIMWAPRRGR